MPATSFSSNWTFLPLAPFPVSAAAAPTCRFCASGARSFQLTRERGYEVRVPLSDLLCSAQCPRGPSRWPRRGISRLTAGSSPRVPRHPHARLCRQARGLFHALGTWAVPRCGHVGCSTLWLRCRVLPARGGASTAFSSSDFTSFG